MTQGLGPSATRFVVFVAAWNAIGFAYAVAFVIFNGYLPQPYFYDADDTFMDFFNTTYWAYNDGRYTDWGSIYPIFTFLLGKIVTPSECYFFDPKFARDCDHTSVWVMLVFALIAAFLNARLFSKDRITQTFCFIAIVLSLPFLFALERGNYVLFAYAFLVLAVISKNKIAEGIFLACAINLKQYLLVLLARTLLEGNLAVLLWFLVSTAVLTVAGSLYLAEPNFLLFVENMFLFSDTENTGALVRLPYAISVDAFISFTKTLGGAFFIDAVNTEYPVINIEYLMLYASFLEFVVRAMVAVVAFRVIRLWGEIDQSYLCYVTLLCLFNLQEAPGAYALLFLLPYLPGVYPLLTRVELAALFLLFQPFDFMYFNIWDYVDTGYFGGDVVIREFGLMLGSAFRPAAVFVLLLLVALRLVRQKRRAYAASGGQFGVVPGSV